MSRYLSDAIRRLVATRADFRCEYCRVPEIGSFYSFQIDHIISLKHSGETQPDNLAYAGILCNRNKGTDLGTRINKGPLNPPPPPSPPPAPRHRLHPAGRYRGPQADRPSAVQTRCGQNAASVPGAPAHRTGVAGRRWIWAFFSVKVAVVLVGLGNTLSSRSG